jgi:hypothetical protein
MRTLIHSAWVLLLTASICQAQAPKPPKLITVGRIAGTLQNAGGTSGMLVVRVSLRRVELNAQGVAHAMRLQRELPYRQYQIYRNPNPFQRQQQLLNLAREVQQAQRNLFTIRETNRDFELQPADQMKVRTTRPDPGFDDRGNIRALTPELLKELRGKENLPGFTAQASDLQTGQTVLVVVAREQGQQPADAKLLATLVMIVAQPRR